MAKTKDLICEICGRGERILDLQYRRHLYSSSKRIKGIVCSRCVQRFLLKGGEEK